MASQIIANGFVAGSAFTLFAVAYGLVFRICGFFDLTFGAVFVVAPYLVAYFTQALGVPVPLAIVFGTIAATGLGVALHSVLYAPMGRRQTSSLVLLLASMGCYTVLVNLLSVVAGDALLTLRPDGNFPPIEIAGAIVTPFQMAIVGVGLGGTLAISLLLSRTSVGTDIRAVASDVVLAELSGMRSSRIAMAGLGIGFGMAAIGGILHAYDVDVTPGAGMQASMNAIVAMILGGSGGLGRAAAGGMLLGMVQNFGAWQIGSQWQDGVTFIILGTFLLLFPKGVPATGRS